jgi:hypothetical protein
MFVLNKGKAKVFSLILITQREFSILFYELADLVSSKIMDDYKRTSHQMLITAI